jgi:hypothetical protein
VPERRRANRIATRLILGQVFATGVLVVSVGLVGQKAANDIHASEAKARGEQATRVETARVAQTQTLRAGCARGVARDFEALGTNRDLAGFARDAARARRATGDEAIARGYDRRAAAAEARMRRVTLRLPAHEDEASITAFCRVLFPNDSPLHP